MKPEMISNNHPVEQGELMAYLDGELSTDRAAATVAHLERCPECQTLAADLRSVSRRLMSFEVDSSSPRLAQGVALALEGRGRKTGKEATIGGGVMQNILHWQWWSGRTWRPVAAGLAVILAVFIVGVANLDRFAMEKRTSSYYYGKLPVASQPVPPAGPVNGRQFDRLEQFAELQSPPSVDFKAAAVNGPMIVRTAEIALTTKEFEQARGGLEDAVRRHHGYMGELKIGTPASDGRTLTATLRLPADQLDATIAELRKLGRVESESQSGQEVTAQYVDLEARLSNARNTEQRLTDLLRQRTGKLSDVLAVETEISRVRGEIERMEAERKNLANQVDFATLNATVTEDYKAQLQVVPVTTSSQLRNAAVDGYRTMVEGVVGVVLLLVSYGPSLLLWGGILFFPGRALWRRVRRNQA